MLSKNIIQRQMLLYPDQIGETYPYCIRQDPDRTGGHNPDALVMDPDTQWI